jgi:hypothetical protein
MTLPLPKNIQDYQGRNMTDDDNQSVEQFKMDKEMHRLIRKYGGPEVYSIYSHLVDSASKKNEWACWPTYESIMEDLGILNRAVIADALHWLFDAGLIEWGLEGRKAWFIPLRTANSSITELLRHIPSFRNRTIRDMYSSDRELSIVLLENANVNQDNVEEKTLDTNVSNGPSGPATDSISAQKITESEENQPKAASVNPPSDNRGLNKRRWRASYEAVQDDFRARSGVMGDLWTVVTGIPPDYQKLNRLAKDYNSMWVVCEGILKMANCEVMDDPLVYLRKVLSNGNGTTTGRNDRGTGMGGPRSARPVATPRHPAAPDPDYWNRPPEDIEREWAEFRL